MNAHINSINAYRAAKRSGELSKRYCQVLGALAEIGQGTDREVAAHLGLTRDQVQPRISELIARDMVIDIKAVRDPHTHKQVRVVALVSDVQRAAHEQQRAEAARKRAEAIGSALVEEFQPELFEGKNS